VERIWGELFDGNHPVEDETIPWEVLPQFSRFTLLRILENTDLTENQIAFGFTYRQLKSIPIFAIKDARNVGPSRLRRLVGDLRICFEKVCNLNSVKLEEQKVENQEDNETSTNIYFDLISTNSFRVFYSRFIESLELFLYEDIRELQVILARADWSPFPKETLDEIGNKFGITRERVRQIEKRILDRNYPITDEIKIFSHLFHFFITSETSNEFKEQVIDFDPDYRLSIEPEHFVALAKFLGKTEIAAQFSSRIDVWKAKELDIKNVRDEIHQHRNQLGLIDLSKSAYELGIGEEKLFRVILEVYPRSIRINNLVLARTKKLNTIIESNIYRQLLVDNEISIDEIKIGLERVATYRKQELIGHPEDVHSLISKLAGDPCRIQNMLFDSTQTPNLSNHDKWLMDLFLDTPDKILHRDEIVEAAIEEGIAIGSINQYLSSSPILRSKGRGIYSLVNVSVSKDKLVNYRIKALADTQKASHEIIFKDNKVFYEVVPNLALLASGAIISNRDERNFFGKSQFQVICDCGNLNSIQKIKITSEGFLTGLTGILHHGIQFHKYNNYDKFVMELIKDKLQVLFLAD
jgi:hypothetical protein